MVKINKRLLIHLEDSSPNLFTHFNPTKYPIYSRYYEQFLDGSERSFFMLYLEYFTDGLYQVSTTDIESFILNGCSLEYIYKPNSYSPIKTFDKLIIEVSNNKAGLQLIELALKTNSINLVKPVIVCDERFDHYSDVIQNLWWASDSIIFLFCYYTGIAFMLKDRYDKAFSEFLKATEISSSRLFPEYLPNLDMYYSYTQRRSSFD